ncbi:MAG: hypothetical protein V4565_06340 [Bacteroidota bacterium]
MSSQFSYELDERQIRMMMQDAEGDVNEALWEKLQEVAIPHSKSFGTIGHLIPSFNLSISRSIIVPVLFVVLIGGLSAMLFSFIDFKKKETIDKEIPLVANPANFNKEKIAKKIEKQNDKILPVVSKDSVIKSEVPSVMSKSMAVTLPVQEVKKEEPAKISEVKPKEVSLSEVLPKKQIIRSSEKKKKSKKVRSEVLPTINATTTTNLNEGVSEPELDLK